MEQGFFARWQPRLNEPEGGVQTRLPVCNEILSVWNSNGVLPLLHTYDSFIHLIYFAVA